MSKKHRKQKDPHDRPGPPTFAVGARVRVKAGVKDPDSPDMPIGGWCGQVADVDDGSPRGYLVRWDQRTIDHMHPVFIKRCRRDDLEVESMWLDEPDLEPDRGELLPIEQPAAVVTRPLDPDDQEDRIRAVFGLTSDDPLPEVSEASLAVYHRHLEERLAFPLDVDFLEETGTQELTRRTLVLVGLTPAERSTLDDGIVARARLGEEQLEVALSDLESRPTGPGRRLIEDYAYWFGTVPPAPSILPFPGLMPDAANLDAEVLGPEQKALVKRVVNTAAMGGAAYGGTIGAVATVVEPARLGMAWGAASLGLLLGYVGWRYGGLLARAGRLRSALPLALLALVVGGVLGALLGALAVVYVGSVSGSIVGTMLGSLLGRSSRKSRAQFLGGAAGAMLGGIALAVYYDWQTALLGLAFGVVAGGIGIVLVLFGALVVFAFLSRPRPPA